MTSSGILICILAIFDLSNKMLRSNWSKVVISLVLSHYFASETISCPVWLFRGSDRSSTICSWQTHRSRDAAIWSLQAQSSSQSQIRAHTDGARWSDRDAIQQLGRDGLGILLYPRWSSVGKNEAYVDELTQSFAAGDKLTFEAKQAIQVQLVWPTVATIRSSILVTLQCITFV